MWRDRVRAGAGAPRPLARAEVRRGPGEVPDASFHARRPNGRISVPGAERLSVRPPGWHPRCRRETVRLSRGRVGETQARTGGAIGRAIEGPRQTGWWTRMR